MFNAQYSRLMEEIINFDISARARYQRLTINMNNEPFEWMLDKKGEIKKLFFIAIKKYCYGLEYRIKFCD